MFWLIATQRDDEPGNDDGMVNSPSDISSIGYDGYDKGGDEQMTQEKISIQSDGGESVIEAKTKANGKIRKVTCVWMWQHNLYADRSWKSILGHTNIFRFGNDSR